ncbi:MAG: cysteine synthase family protein [Gemmatimonadetes bacterium]|nr:cysteine synthase family protein [Gemmatimonadota bacterium]
MLSPFPASFSSALDMVGRTPHLHVRVPGLAARLHAKLEGANPTGSLKDRAGLFMLQDAIASGALRPGMTVLDASSGNMACTLAYFGRLLGYPSMLVVNSKLTEDKRNFLRYMGARLEEVGDFTVQGNEWCRELVAREGTDRWFFADQLNNWSNPRASYETTGPEILDAFPEVAMVVASLGSAGTLLGMGQFLKERRPGVKVVGVQSAPGTRIPGTGSFEEGDYVSPFFRQGVADGTFDRLVRITHADAVRGTLALRDQGVFVGIQTGGVFHAAVQAAGEMGIAGDVVFVSGDSGWKNMDKLLPLVSGA